MEWSCPKRLGYLCNGRTPYGWAAALSAAKIIGETAHAGRFRSEDAYARHNGTAPLPVWSSNKQRHRLSREDGLRTGSLRRIADLSGYSTAAIYKFFNSKQHLVAEVLNRRGDEYLVELRQAARSAGTPLDRLHLVVDTAATYFRARGHFRSVVRQMQGGSAILGPVLDAFAEDVYGR